MGRGFAGKLTLRKKIMAGLSVSCLIAFWLCLPDPLFTRPVSFVIEDSKGELLGASIAEDGQWRFPLADSVPDKFKKCITAFEDKRFNIHPGVDLLSLARAIRQNIAAGRVVSGGSTITMQVIRLATGSKRTVANKILESIRAVRLEMTFSKSEILALYASNAPFGSNVVGLEAASWRYFGRSADQLSWGETAALAVLPNAPSLVHPGRNRKVLLQKRNRLISTLRQEGIINSTEEKLAKLEPVPQKPIPLPQLAPHLLALAKKDYHAGKLNSSRIKTSVSLQLQQQVDGVLNIHHERLLANGVNNLAALILDIETGNVLAYNGNIFRPENKEIESHVDIIQSRRSPGSILKPLLYAAMLSEGMLLPNSLVADIPTQIAGYQPNNYDLGYDGAVPASKALARSLNVPAVRMLRQYKYERFHDILKKLGITTLNQPPDFYGLSLILGGGEVSMWDIAGVYARMARALIHGSQERSHRAKWHAPRYIADSQDKNHVSNESAMLLDRGAIWNTFEAMNEVMRPGEEQLWQQFDSSQKIAWKTGTSFGFRDAWAIGLSTKYVVAVWAGNADGEGRPGLTGIDAAAPVLFDIFRLLPSSAGKWFTMPAADMVKIDACAESGFRASELCVHKQAEFVPKAGLKAPVCPYHRLIHLDKNEKWQVTDDCVQPSDMVHKAWFVLPPAMEYYYQNKDFRYKPLPPFRPGCVGSDASASSPMEMIYPKDNARIYVPYELSGARGQVIFNAAHRKAGETIYWHLDDEYIGSTGNLHQLALNPAAGRHTITLIDMEGNRLEQTFTILDKEKN
ncbi:penicillin-binding protein 1C [Arcticibacter tournemirensis]